MTVLTAGASRIGFTQAKFPQPSGAALPYLKNASRDRAGTKTSLNLFITDIRLLLNGQNYFVPFLGQNTGAVIPCFPSCLGSSANKISSQITDALARTATQTIIIS